jgi:pimeloyl-ACP methyl ester carboxylesterase
MQTIVVSANGVQFHCLEEGTGPLALCLHGFPDHAPTWRFQLQALAQAGYRAVAPYMRGYAPTVAPPDGPFQTAALAQDIVGLIDALGGGPAALIGHDWGAAAAYGAAVVAPEKIGKLVTLAVPYGGAIATAFVTNPLQQCRSWYMFFFQLPIADTAFAHDDFAMVRRFWRDWSPGFALPEDEMAALIATFRAPGTAQAALGYYRDHMQPARQRAELVDVQARLRRDTIHVPTLYLHGAHDACIGPEVGTDQGVYFSAGHRRVVVDGAGHFLHREKSDAVNAEILGFLRA